ncbi:SRPBCC family protein [Actinocorallia sp. API 0066]|uniref:SRPBCC family protein n=1 Tax=Actinocorallia sp. API 0066 TaxID=2896846 RepID=UPI001E589941|nr:SRPBCC family protein [Actinocorallia sp. API 0066]MCD0451588.1 SRPBCC family protein [Actinocorallia sp. API 0066]
MAVREVFIDQPPDIVWGVLSDGKKYAEWVVGTRKVQEVDPGWPAPGASLQYVARYGPFGLSDRTVVRICAPPERLEMEIKAGPFGSVRVAIRLIPWGTGTVVILDEHPLRGISAGLHGPLSELVLHVRNRLMLRELAHTVERSAARQRPAARGTTKPSRTTAGQGARRGTG